MYLFVEYIVISYLIGAIPFGYLLSRRYAGINPLKHGSGNIGSTNVERLAGKRIAFYTQIFDMMKGLFPVFFYMTFLQTITKFYVDYGTLYVALACILGHDFSVFLKFRGGKGVNTTLGAFVVIAPLSVLSAIALYFIVKFIFKYVSVGSIAIAISLPLFSILYSQSLPITCSLLVAGILIIVRHFSNIKRLINGNENH